MQFLDNFIYFIHSKSISELIFLFWYFFIFDFARYLATDLIFITYYFLFWKRDKKRIKDAKAALFAAQPFISVIVPGKNEGKHLDALVQSLYRQTYKNFETIIIDDGSDDDTEKIGRYLEQHNKIDLFLRNNTRGGKASAANFGLRFAKGEFIVHLDADTSMREDALENIIMPFYMNINIGAVAGDVRVRNVNSSMATTLQAFEYLKNISLSRAINSKFNILRIVSGAFGAFRRDYLERVGAWDIGPGLDGDITVKIRKIKKRIWFENSAICYTNVPNTFKKLARQRYRWSRSLVRFRLRKHLNVFDLRSKNFNIFNFISALENVFFNFVLNFKWWLYVFFLIYFDYNELKYLVIFNYILYVILNVLQFLICIVLLYKTMRFKDWSLIIYSFLMPLYTGLYLRMVRTYAYFMEIFFKTSYYDSWNPWKVSTKAKEDKF